MMLQTLALERAAQLVHFEAIGGDSKGTDSSVWAQVVPVHLNPDRHAATPEQELVDKRMTKEQSRK